MKILIILASLCALLGIYIAYQIKKNKSLYKQGGKMVCLVGHKCDQVVFSDYSKFLGINLEIMGLLYYVSAFVFYIVYLFQPQLINELVLFISLGLTFGGFLFSIYLTYIQIFKLKSLCSWCLSSALISTVIFFIGYSLAIISKPEIMSYINQISPFIRVFEYITIVLGVSIFIILEIIIFRFLKDFKITPRENEVLKTISQIGWFVIFLFILNNVGLYLPEYVSGDSPLRELGRGLFWPELITLVLIIINTAVSHIQILPELRQVKSDATTLHVEKIIFLRRVSFFQSFASIILWLILFDINVLM